MNEAGIRDLLAADLSLLEGGLELLEIEQYIPPGTLGTRNFLDILAKDRAGQWVIIEVKKTDAAAREAAHEVFKYVEAVQRHFGVRTDEIRAIVAAVEWKELLVPFSRLLSETSIAIEGVRITLDAQGQALRKVEKVEPVRVDQGRYLAPWHEVNLYKDGESLARGIESYDASCKSKGVTDYVMVVLRPAEVFHENAKAATANMFGAIEALFGESGSPLPVFGEPDRHEFMLYFAPQLLDRQFCLDVLSRDSIALDEATGLEAEGSEAELCTLHTSLYDLAPRPARDYFEIGYAAKFASKILGDEGWTVDRVIRRGTFARNNLLTDEAIVEELKGVTGSSKQNFKRRIELANPAHLAGAKEGLADALETNPVWLAHIRRVLDEAASTWSTCSAHIDAFAPSSGLFSLYFIATDEEPFGHLPMYEVAVIDTDHRIVAAYIGLLAPNGDAPLTFQAMLDKYYNGRLGQLMFLASAGFFERRDVDVMEDLGLAYRTFLLIDPQGASKWFALKDDRWKAFTPSLPFQPLQPWLDKYGDLVDEIIEAIGSRMHGGFHDMS